MEKLYVLIRKDLSVGQQAVQGGHAVAEFVYGRCHKWRQATPFVYVLVEDLTDLVKYQIQVSQRIIPYRMFYEADIGLEPTALACLHDGNMFDQLELLT